MNNYVFAPESIIIIINVALKTDTLHIYSGLDFNAKSYYKVCPICHWHPDPGRCTL